MKSKVFYLIYKLIGQYLPTSKYFWGVGSKLRGFLSKNFVSEFGKGVNIERKSQFSPRLKIGDGSGVGINSQLRGDVTIGKDVLMGPECWIYTRNHEFKSKESLIRNQGYLPEQPVIIGDDVWIGGRVTILPGVKIGTGVVIGACTVVTKDIPDYAIVVGNPGRVVGYRE